ncbi:hypothetical protein LCGC14_2686870, partial [marine sediment metagenome]
LGIGDDRLELIQGSVQLLAELAIVDYPQFRQFIQLCLHFLDCDFSHCCVPPLMMNLPRAGCLLGSRVFPEPDLEINIAVQGSQEGKRKKLKMFIFQIIDSILIPILQNVFFFCRNNKHLTHNYFKV